MFLMLFWLYFLGKTKVIPHELVMREACICAAGLPGEVSVF